MLAINCVNQFASLLLVAVVTLPSVVTGQNIPEPVAPEIAAASDEGQQAIGEFKYPSNLVATLFAAEPDVANPVAIDVDNSGRLFVCESFRQEQGVEDNREHNDWLNDDLAAQTVSDRVAYMKRHYPDQWTSEFEAQDDQIRLLVDTDRDGTADASQVFSNRYNGIAMGTGAGVLHYRDNVYFTCIPDLWLLKDKNNDGVADDRKSLHTGFGVRFAFRGHDLHGLIIGPDGRLYFSIGDRGYNLGNEIKDPASGAVFRCELDGSHLEVVATGLRNPQELAFDNHGNLFTGDNNSDSGDKARWVYIVPGGDSGWRMHYQYLNDRGPFNREHIWETYDPSVTPAYIVPPIDNISDGPSGLAFYPGTGFGEQFQDRFFLCDFRGTSTLSGIRSFKNEADGAFFKVTDMDQTLWQILATDLDFGPDGRLYVADWVFGWVGENKGRIYTFHDPTQIESAVVHQVKMLLDGGIKSLENDALVQLLGHADRRIRQESQFELVERDQLRILEQVAATDKRRFARLHAIWGIGQLARLASYKQGDRIDDVLKSSTHELIKKLIDDDDAEVRAQACKLAGDSMQYDLAVDVANKMADDNLRVRHFAALAIGKIGIGPQIMGVVTMLAENMDLDPIVRHSGIMALVGLVKRNQAPIEILSEFTKHPSDSVRLATVVALRKLNSDLVQKFLNDPDLQIRIEAARAVYDLPINAAIPKLAAMITETETEDAIVRRAIHANVRMGKPEHAQALAKFAANPAANEARRMDAIAALADWGSPPPRDGVLGEWRPLSPRDWTEARDALATHFSDIVNGSEPIKAAAVAAAGKLQLLTVGKSIEPIVENSDVADSTRAAALSALLAIDYAEIDVVLNELESDFNSLPDRLAATLAKTVCDRDPERGLKLIMEILNADDLFTRDPSKGFERQRIAIQTLGEMTDEKSAEAILDLMNAVMKSEYVDDLRLDVVNACASRKEPDLIEKLASYQESLNSSDDPTTRFRDTLFGGNAVAGEKVFTGKTEVSCVRCHKINGNGGEVGPDLSTIAVTRDRQYLLEAMVVPNKIIANGYAQMIVATVDGLTHTGIVVEETNALIRLLDADAKTITILKDDIEATRMGLSSMPTDLIEHLSFTEIRDLIEYLANRRVNEATTEGHQ